MIGIIEVEVSKLRIHPKNVRKNYDGIDELADSIKAQGVLQNLTVVPNPEEEGTYWVVIGNRRLLAATKAKIETVPCRIVEMSEVDQASTMLLENMQREDLTVYEQAQAFQYVMDLGETEEGLAEKTGLSRSTIRHRLNIAKLDQDLLMKRENEAGFQLSLTDLYELERIKDINARNEVLEKASDSRDLKWRAKQAFDTQEKKENLALFMELLSEMGIEEEPDTAKKEFYTGKWETVQEYRLNSTPPETLELDNVKFGEKVYYRVEYNRLLIIRRKKKVEKILTPAEEEKKQHVREKKQLKALLKNMTDTRRVFIGEIIAGKIKPLKKTVKLEVTLFDMILSHGAFIGNNTLRGFFVEKDWYSAPQEEKVKAETEIQKLSMLHKMLCVLSELVGNLELMDYTYAYNKTAGDKLKAFYDILELYGFSFANDDEIAAVNGTSDLYVKKDSAENDAACDSEEVSEIEE